MCKNASFLMVVYTVEYNTKGQQIHIEISSQIPSKVA